MNKADTALQAAEPGKGTHDIYNELCDRLRHKPELNQTQRLKSP